MGWSTLEIEKTEGVARLWLNRPATRNAFTAEMIAEIAAAMAELGADAAVRAVALGGRGAAFCAGADLSWMREAAGWDAEENRADAARLAAMLRAIAECPKPVVARVHGPAFGGGVGLACAADVCLAGPQALFSLSEVRLGLLPATIAPYVLRAMGPRQAGRYWLTAERFGAAEAARIGVAHAAFEDDAALDAGVERALGHLKEGAPGAIAATKALIALASDRPNTLELDAETAARIAALRVGAEAQEGLAAFFEKRPPAWRR